MTYEAKNTTSPLETYEWDNTWWDYSKPDCEKRVLVIGDSMTVGYRRVLVTVSEDKWAVDGFGTSKAVDNRFFKPSVDLFLAQQEPYDLILFNNGLHGWHLSVEEYASYYRDFALFLKEKQTPLVLVLTTPVRNCENLFVFDARNDEVLLRNKAVLAVAEEWDIPTVDLYSLLQDKPHLCTDGVHLSPAGYQLVAETIYNAVT